MKIKPEDLDKIAEKTRSEARLREDGIRVRINVHMGTCGIASGAKDILKNFLDEIDEHEAKDVQLTTTGCAGLCSSEPMATIETVHDRAPVKYINLTESKVRRIYEDHVMGGKPVVKYALGMGSERLG
ncbi:MAG TPA: (2Fe-2S) ferredoxin domain-containing protein [Sediminispirochaeta sp.]|nr:(2Fe-2S) ferredoxin domain-containing protein [Sediminispirochaeta sp.]